MARRGGEHLSGMPNKLVQVQDQWQALKRQGSDFHAGNGTMLLQVISNAAATFPDCERRQLAADLLQVSKASLEHGRNSDSRSWSPTAILSGSAFEAGNDLRRVTCALLTCIPLRAVLLP